jgi:SH3-like domain-containing protein
MIRRFRPARLARLARLAGALVLVLGGALAPGPGEAQDKTRGTGLPLPRFVSLKSDNVNVRRGPGQEYEVDFTFVRADLPVEITQEFDNWRKIRDSEGAEGWVFHSLLAGKRTALVAPWDKGGPFPAYVRADAKAAVVAYLEPKVIAAVEQCTGTWCEISVKNYDGWIEQDRLWGVYPDEEFQE